MTRRATRSPLAWLGALLVLYLVVPLAAFAVRVSGSHQRGFGSPGLWNAFGVSVGSATISMLVIAVLGIPLAHWLARSPGPLGSAIGVLVQLPLALPPVMSGIVLIYLAGPYTTLGRLFGGRITDSVAGVVLAQTFVSAPFLIIAARSAFAAIDPALDDLAATLGHRPLARFWRVSLPIAAPGIRAGLLLTWLRAFGEYGATVLLAYHPYSLPVFTYVQFSGTGIPTTQAPTVLAIGAAAGAVLLSRLHRGPRLRRCAAMPEPRAPRPSRPAPVSFDLDTMIGTFRLRLAHQSSSHRLAILGPSGSGKSVTLRCLAGLLGPGAGPVSYGGELVTELPAPARGIGYVPQHLGLFPGRTVWQQLLFATDADEHLAAWWLHTLHLDELRDRLPGQLSGGQRQRVSLAQALSHHPRCVLLDEPFSALDAPVREELRRELRRLQHEVGLSTVLVTHDPEEAALLADEILVIADGRLLQAGTRSEVYRRPASPQVARLLGIPNLVPARVRSTGTIDVSGVLVAADTGELPANTEVLWCIRAEHIAVRADGGAGGYEDPDSYADSHGYAGTVIDVADLGTVTSLTVRLAADIELRARTTDPIELAAGDACRVRLDPAAITLWAAAAGSSAGLA